MGCIIINLLIKYEMISIGSKILKNNLKLPKYSPIGHLN